jgi:TonB-dependent SusC/RagA subfamily outer membrane receptor
MRTPTLAWRMRATTPSAHDGVRPGYSRKRTHTGASTNDVFLFAAPDIPPDACSSSTSGSAATVMMFSASRAAHTALGLLVLATACAKSRTVGPVPMRNDPTVTAEDLAKNTGRPIEEVIQAKVPGVIVSRTDDGGIALQIRGTSSFMSSNQPLFVIDDVPMTPGPRGALTGVNPHDIESIRVLKDPADIGIYGMRGANGVIVVKTKKPGAKRSY